MIIETFTETQWNGEKKNKHAFAKVKFLFGKEIPYSHLAE